MTGHLYTYFLFCSWSKSKYLFSPVYSKTVILIALLSGNDLRGKREKQSQFNYKNYFNGLIYIQMWNLCTSAEAQNIRIMR